MAYLLKMVIFHGYVTNNQMVYIYSIWQDSNDIPIGDNGLAYESMTVQDPYPPKKTDWLRV